VFAGVPEPSIGALLWSVSEASGGSVVRTGATHGRRDETSAALVGELESESIAGGRGDVRGTCNVHRMRPFG
jgi:hypothetical protein